MQYRYRALNTQGKIVSGECVANSQAEIIAYLNNQGLELIQAHQKPPRNSTLGRAQQLDFFFQLAHLTAAGIPLIEALTDLAQADMPKPITRLATNLAHEINNGQSLSVALANSTAFSDERIGALLHAGEHSGQLAESLEEICRNLHWEQALISSTQKLLIYPSIAACIVLASTLFLLLYLAPQLRPFLIGLGQELPWATRSLFACAEFLQNHGGKLITLLIAAGLTIPGLFKYLPTTRLWFDRGLLKIPLLGDIFRKLATLRLARTLSSLYRSGVPILSALECLPGLLKNRWLSESLKRSQHAISHGSTLSSAFTLDHAFPPLLARMLKLGEQSGQLEQALNQLDKVYSREIEVSIERLQTLIEPILSLFLGLMLAWVCLALIAPIYDVLARGSL